MPITQTINNKQLSTRDHPIINFLITGEILD